jgi:hypothetical protein
MNWSHGGDFTKSLLGLQLQLQTLLEGVGGEGTATLLDALAKLSEAERAAIIPLFTKLVHRVADGSQRLFSDEENALKEFEDSLFESVLSAIGGQSNHGNPADEREGSKRLAVVSGGKPTSERSIFRKPVRISSTIDLAKARESRRQRRHSGQELP